MNNLNSLQNVSYGSLRFFSIVEQYVLKYTKIRDKFTISFADSAAAAFSAWQ
jgi:hypothetical protein